MKLIYTLLFGTAESKLLPTPSLYLEKIRNNEAQLTAFFSQMQKEAIYTTILAVPSMPNRY
jgi:adenosine deaminase/adenosine deaminase CECR1